MQPNGLPWHVARVTGASYTTKASCTLKGIMTPRLCNLQINDFLKGEGGPLAFTLWKISAWMIEWLLTVI